MHKVLEQYFCNLFFDFFLFPFPSIFLFYFLSSPLFYLFIIIIISIFPPFLEREGDTLSTDKKWSMFLKNHSKTISQFFK
jgi:hypothetical protein